MNEMLLDEAGVRWRRTAFHQHELVVLLGWVGAEEDHAPALQVFVRYLQPHDASVKVSLLHEVLSVYPYVTQSADSWHRLLPPHGAVRDRSSDLTRMRRTYARSLY